jgi:G3E family GTPase
MGDFILLNKADLVNEEQFKLVQQKVREINDRAVLFKTVYCNGNLDYTLFFGYFIEKDVKSKTHIYHENFEYLYFEYEGKFSREKFEDFLSNLPNEIYRGKGFVIFEDGSYLFNFIAKRVNFEPFEYNKNKLLFIGEGISKYKEKLNEELIKILK